MTSPIMAQSRPDPQYPNPPVKMWGGAFKTLTICAAAGLVLFVVLIAMGRSELERGKEVGLKILEDKLKLEKTHVSKYENVREFVRAKVEKRSPRLTPDESDEAKAIAEKFAESHSLRDVLED